MDYKNEKLNIEIINNIFRIEEGDGQIDLYFEQELAYTISANSKILSSVLGFGNVSIETYNNSRIKAYGKSLVTSHDNSRLEVWDSTKVISFNNSVIKAYDESSVTAYGNSEVEAYQDSTVEVWGNSSAVAFNKAEIEARRNSRVVSCQNSKITAYDSSEVIARDNSLIKAYCASKVRACAHSKIMAYDFSTIYVDSIYTEIKTHNHYGAIIGQVFKVTKPIRVYKKLADDLIATLELSKGQEFQSELHHKCRTDRALVVAIESKDRSKSYESGVSQHDSKFIYEVGKEAVADKYYSGISECSHGIHFFLNRKSAEEY